MQLRTNVSVFSPILCLTILRAVHCFKTALTIEEGLFCFKIPRSPATAAFDITHFATVEELIVFDGGGLGRQAVSNKLFAIDRFGWTTTAPLIVSDGRRSGRQTARHPDIESFGLAELKNCCGATKQLSAALFMVSHGYTLAQSLAHSQAATRKHKQEQ